MSETSEIVVDTCIGALETAGMSRREACAKAQRFARARRALAAFSGRTDLARAWFVPGRLEVAGKHTDYAGGRSLVCAVERGYCVVALPREDSAFRIVDAANGSVVAGALDANRPSRAPGWALYPTTVARRFARNFPEARRGADMAFASDLPAAAGMSSSSAMMIGIFLVLADLNRIESLESYRSDIRTNEDLAGYLATIENGQDFGTLAGDAGVGTFGGSEDHVAILCSHPSRLAQYAFAPVRHERDIALPPGYVFAVAASGVAAQKTGAARAAYNDAATKVREIVDLWHRATGREGDSLGAAVASHPAAADRIRALVGAPVSTASTSRLLDRFEQFVEESERIVPQVGDALSSSDLARFGGLIDRSQELAERLLRNQVPETIALARSARALGAAASSAFGAGFGGSVWALAPKTDSDAFTKRWAAEYAREFPGAAQNACFFTTSPGPAALKL
jgi:galactokinase